MSNYASFQSCPSQNASVVIDRSRYSGSFITVSVKPIFSVDATVDFTIPAYFTVDQFHQMIEQTIREGRVFADIERPTFAHAFDIVPVGQSLAPYDSRIILPVELRAQWQGRSASEFAPEMDPYSRELMEPYMDGSFYLRYVHFQGVDTQPSAILETSTVAAVLEGEISELVPWQDESMDAPMTLDELEDRL